MVSHKNAAATDSVTEVDPHTSKLLVQYTDSIGSLKEIFADWSEIDLAYILEEAHGDFELALSRISEGQAEQWGEARRRKEKTKTGNATQSYRTGNQNQGQFRNGNGGFGQDRSSFPPRGK
eukprot:jgi/Hompol1/1429/HPOL_002698-RA